MAGLGYRLLHSQGRRQPDLPTHSPGPDSFKPHQVGSGAGHAAPTRGPHPTPRSPHTPGLPQPGAVPRSGCCQSLPGCIQGTPRSAREGSLTLTPAPWPWSFSGLLSPLLAFPGLSTILIPPGAQQRSSYRAGRAQCSGRAGPRWAREGLSCRRAAGNTRGLIQARRSEGAEGGGGRRERRTQNPGRTEGGTAAGETLWGSSPCLEPPPPWCALGT